MFSSPSPEEASVWLAVSAVTLGTTPSYHAQPLAQDDRPLRSLILLCFVLRHSIVLASWQLSMYPRLAHWLCFLSPGIAGVDHLLPRSVCLLWVFHIRSQGGGLPRVGEPQQADRGREGCFRIQTAKGRVEGLVSWWSQQGIPFAMGLQSENLQPAEVKELRGARSLRS